MGLIKKPTDISPKRAISMLIFGQPGMGKTTLALSSYAPVLFDADNGVNRVHPEHFVPTLQVTCWEDIVEGLKEVNASNEYQTIVIDTLGKSVAFIEKWIMDHDLEVNRKLTWTNRSGAITQAGYKERKAMWKGFITSVLGAGKSVIILGHAIEMKKDNGQIVYRLDAGSDGFAGDIYKDMDLVGFLTGEGNVRNLIFQSNDSHFCKKTGSMLNEYAVPVVVDENGNAVGKNTFLMDTIFRTYMNDQAKANDVRAAYEKLKEKQAAAIAAISTPEEANKFCASMAKTPQIYDSLLVARTAFVAKVNELGFVLEGKKYVKPANNETANA